MHAKPTRRRTLAFVAAALVLAVFACNAPREDELECEEAVSRLMHCCPGFNANGIQCVYSSGCGSTTYPALSVREARCVRDSSCDALVANGVCTRAASAHAQTRDSSSSSSSYYLPPPSSGVCP